MIQKFFVYTFIALSLMLTQSSAFAKDCKGSSFADDVKVDGTTLKLNGIGVRSVYSIVQVYVAGLYLAQPAKTAEDVLKQTTPKQLVMKFKRWVEKGQLQSAWKEGFEKKDNHEEGYSYRSDLNALNDAMTHMNNNDQMVITFFKDHVDVQAKDKPTVTIKGEQFSRVLQKVFLKDPPDEDLKKGLLAEKECK